ncbi:MAG: Kazal-type serine protease inhibitor family protein [Acidobacteriota bacterium]
MRTILFASLLAIAACATSGGEQPDTSAGGKADGTSKPSGIYTNPAPHAGELASLNLMADGRFERTTTVECQLPTCEPLASSGTYALTRGDSDHYIHFYGDDGRSLDRYQWDLADGNLELARDGSSDWFEMDAAAAKMCGGFLGALCDDGYFCDYGAGSCGADDRSGVCKPIPAVCEQSVMPVCGCDGQTYTNACEANMAGYSTLHDGACTGN